MRIRITIILFLLCPCISLLAQKPEFGIKYNPINFSRLTFDQDFVIYDDYTSQRTTGKFFMSFPSLSNSGLFIRFPYRKLAVETGVNLQNNTYFYGKKITYQNTNVSFFYCSVDVHLSLAYTVNPDNIVKFRLLAGVNSKLFKIRRNYYSIFAKGFDYFFYSEEYKADREKREFMVDKVNPFILYSRFGAGIQYFQWTVDLCMDKNLTGMNTKENPYNANFRNSEFVSLILGFRFAGKDLKYKRNTFRITKE